MIITNKAKFIMGIENDEIIVNKKSHSKIMAQLEEKEFDKGPNDNYDYLIKLPIYNLTKEKILELNAKLQGLGKVYDELKAKKLETLWLDDIGVLEKIMG